ncbi:MAG: hypothetical protein V3T60_16630 [Candidatus Binatia bacterium]
MRRSKSRPHKDRRRFNRQDPRFVRKRAAAEEAAVREDEVETPWWERNMAEYGRNKKAGAG